MAAAPAHRNAAIDRAFAGAPGRAELFQHHGQVKTIAVHGYLHIIEPRFETERLGLQRTPSPAQTGPFDEQGHAGFNLKIDPQVLCIEFSPGQVRHPQLLFRGAAYGQQLLQMHIAGDARERQAAVRMPHNPLIDPNPRCCPLRRIPGEQIGFGFEAAVDRETGRRLGKTLQLDVGGWREGWNGNLHDDLRAVHLCIDKDVEPWKKFTPMGGFGPKALRQQAQPPVQAAQIFLLPPHRFRLEDTGRPLRLHGPLQGQADMQTEHAHPPRAVGDVSVIQVQFAAEQELSVFTLLNTDTGPGVGQLCGGGVQVHARSRQVGRCIDANALRAFDVAGDCQFGAVCRPHGQPDLQVRRGPLQAGRENLAVVGAGCRDAGCLAGGGHVPAPNDQAIVRGSTGPRGAELELYRAVVR